MDELKWTSSNGRAQSDLEKIGVIMDSQAPKTKAALLEAIQNQIDQNNPPETKQTLNRLLKSGISKDDAYIYLAQALSAEMFAMMKQSRKYSLDNYKRLLSLLPDLHDEG